MNSQSDDRKTIAVLGVTSMARASPSARAKRNE